MHRNVNHNDATKLKNETTLWRTDNFDGLDLIHAYFQEFKFAPHTHNEFMIGVTESGHGCPRLVGKSYSVHFDDIILLNPGDIQSGATSGDSSWQYRGFYPSTSLMRLAAREQETGDRQLPAFPQSVVNDPYMADMLRRMLRSLEKQLSRLQSESLILRTLAMLLKRQGDSRYNTQAMGCEHRSVKLAKEYLQALPGQNVTLEELAHVADLSPYYFCRVFHRETGLSPHTYQLLVRLRYAKELLGKGTPISQTALQAGFFDQAHFTRHFKRVYGISPTHFLQNIG